MGGEIVKFPEGFYWGAATSSHQVEGGNRNDWTEWEHANAERLAREAEQEFGSLPNWSAIKTQAKDRSNYISGRATDHYHRFREDFDIAKRLGHNAHRFSIEWSRIEPEDGKFNEQAVEHYREVVRALRERGMEPFVTLWHWTIPLWLRDRGGVTASVFPQRFARYTRYVAEKLREDVKFWMTLNEPTSVIAHSYFRGVWPPQRRGVVPAIAAFRILAAAHRAGYRAIHEVAPHAQVGFGNILIYLEPHRNSILDRLAVTVRDWWANRYFLSLTGDTHDYFAIQYYFHVRLRFPNQTKNENVRISDMGWELFPEGHYHLLMRFAEREKPMYITESGLADALDANRAWYIRESLKSINRAVHDGADVRGYFYWSLLDNFEWNKGFWPRFGLVAVDYRTLERKIRPSAWGYRDIIGANAIPA